MIELAKITDLQQRIARYDDIQAYKELFKFFFDPLHRFTYSIIKCREAAEEIVSDVFIKVWQIRKELAGIKNLKVYLYTATKNGSLNYRAKYYKLPVVSLDEIELETLVTLANPEELYISTDICNKINQAISQLPAQCKLIFQLVKEDGLKYKEVAQVLDISVFTVRNQVAIAAKKIGTAVPAHLSSFVRLSEKFSSS